jgi:hypothetical protein
MSEPDPAEDKPLSGYKPAAKKANPAEVAKTATGCALVALGLLILLPSGLCTAILGIAMIADGFRDGPEMLNFLMLALVLTAIGAVIVYAGSKVGKR